MTARIREFLKTRKDPGPCLVLDLDVVRDNYLAFAKTLPDTKVFYAVKANPAPEILKLLASLGSCFDVASVGEIDMVLAAGATPERISYGNTDQEGERDRLRLRQGHHALRRRLRGRGREDRPRRARQPGDLPHPLRRHRRRMAAVAQVRLRAGLRHGHPGARPPAGPRRPRHLVPRRLPAGQRRGLGPGAGLDRRGVPLLRRARHQPVDGQPGRRLPGQVHPQDAEAGILRQGDLPGAAPALRQRRSRTPSSSRAAAWSATPA